MAYMTIPIPLRTHVSVNSRRDSRRGATANRTAMTTLRSRRNNLTAADSSIHDVTLRPSLAISYGPRSVATRATDGSTGCYVLSQVSEVRCDDIHSDDVEWPICSKLAEPVFPSQALPQTIKRPLSIPQIHAVVPQSLMLGESTCCRGTAHGVRGNRGRAVSYRVMHTVHN